MQIAVKTDTVATQQEAYFYARVAAAVDFVNEIDKDLWRNHVQEQHAHGFPWQRDINANPAKMG